MPTGLLRLGGVDAVEPHAVAPPVLHHVERIAVNHVDQERLVDSPVAIAQQVGRQTAVKVQHGVVLPAVP